ncbi:MAG: hypothetical protein ACFFDN_51270 [Candidatus Hodarchaeota archaeon]
MLNFKINEYISLHLENGITNIYVKGAYFNQCKFLLMNIPIQDIEKYNEITSIDEMVEKLDNSMEDRERSPIWLSPEEKFWAHCSNLQV